MTRRRPPGNANSRRKGRKGNITILAAIFCIVLLGMVAFSVDIGYVLSVKEQMQRTADATGLAAGWEFAQNLSEGCGSAEAQYYARNAAPRYAAANRVGNISPALDLNFENLSSGDVLFGYISDFDAPQLTLDTTNSALFNAVRVRVRRDSNLNGEVPLFFARVFGLGSQAAQTEATAAFVRDVRGFRAPNDGSDVEILPIALDDYTWDRWPEEPGDEETLIEVTDDWTWNTSTKRVEEGGDGKPEVNLYPKGNGSPGNRGMVDIGNSNNSTKDIARQILYGISDADLAHHGGSLEFDSDGKLYLNGDTGISAGVKDELDAIIGQPGVIPIFTAVNGPGNNAMYTIEHWQGVRIMDVRLTGPMNKKHVTIQRADVSTKGAIPSDTPGTSKNIYSPVILVE